MTPTRVLQTQPLWLEQPQPLSQTDEFSPYVWREADRFRIALRSLTYAKDPSEQRSTIYFGESHDGVTFTIDPMPSIAPDAGPDAWGCEDPTVVVTPEQIHVLYSGWDGTTSRMLRASGPSLTELKKMGEVLPDVSPFAMTKEAAVFPSTQGLHLLFEYATEGASRIGMAMGTTLTEPFTVTASPLLPRKDRWDSWHLSPCDCITWNGRTIVIYSGSDRDARWRIGWAEFDANGHLIARAKEPFISPFGLQTNDTDIAFAGSAVVHDGALWIYYSIADRSLYRSQVEIGDDGDLVTVATEAATVA